MDPLSCHTPICAAQAAGARKRSCRHPSERAVRASWPGTQRFCLLDDRGRNLTAQPEILTAHRRHRRLIRRHGRDTVMRAFRDARYICLGWRLDGIPDDGYARRMEIFHGPGWRDRGDDEIQTSDAAAYQQAVALTRLLASPCWRERILGKDRLWPEEFEAEVRRAVAPGYIWGIYPRTRWPGRPAARMAISHPPPGIRAAPTRAHPWSLPETIRTGSGDTCLDHTETAR